MKMVVALMLLMASVGCEFATEPTQDPSGQSGALTTDRGSYTAGATVALRLRNVFQHQIGYNLCTSALERQNGDSWQPAEYGNDRFCTMELRTLQPGGSDTYSFQLDARLQSGMYRFRTSLENMTASSRSQIVSNTFAVTR